MFLTVCAIINGRFGDATTTCLRAKVVKDKRGHWSWLFGNFLKEKKYMYLEGSRDVKVLWMTAMCVSRTLRTGEKDYLGTGYSQPDVNLLIHMNL